MTIQPISFETVIIREEWEYVKAVFTPDEEWWLQRLKLARDGWTIVQGYPEGTGYVIELKRLAARKGTTT